MNARFCDYVTSGAFQLSLTRNQIATLSLMAGGCWPFSTGALERKGLCEVLSASSAGAQPEVRLTGAGALCLALLAEAGLAAGARNALAAEIDDLRAQLAAARQERDEGRLTVRAALARKSDAEAELAFVRRELEAERAGVRLKSGPADWRAPAVRLRDPLPDVADADLLGGAE